MSGRNARGRGRGGVSRTARMEGRRVVLVGGGGPSTANPPKTLDQRFSMLKANTGKLRAQATSRQTDARHVAMMAKRTGKGKEVFVNQVPSRAPSARGRGRGRGRGISVGKPRAATAVARPTSQRARGRGRGRGAATTTVARKKKVPEGGGGGAPRGGGRGGGGRGRGRGRGGRGAGGGRGAKKGEAVNADFLDTQLDTYMSSANDIPME